MTEPKDPPTEEIERTEKVEIERTETIEKPTEDPDAAGEEEDEVSPA